MHRYLAAFSCSWFVSLAVSDDCNPVAVGLHSYGYGAVYTLFSTTLDGRPALLAGGIFEIAGGVRANNVARWDGANWAPMGNEFNGSVHAFAELHGQIYAAGRFNGHGAVHRPRFIAQWNGSGWTPLADVPDAAILTMVTADLGDGLALYVGGEFESIGSTSARHVARYDGQSWRALRGAFDNDVYGLTAGDLGDGTKLYATGVFMNIGQTPADAVAAWDGFEWTPVGEGLTTATSPAIFDDGDGPHLYVTSVGSTKKWDGVSAWTSIGGGTALRVGDDGSGPSLFIGRALVTYSSTPAVRRYRNGVVTDFSDGPTYGGVVALTTHDDGNGEKLYVGGTTSQLASGLPLNLVARWDGAAWSQVGPCRAETQCRVFEYADGELAASANGPYPWQQLAIDGDVIVAGAPSIFGSYLNSGGGLVFRRRDGEWALEARLAPLDSPQANYLGSSVDVHGDRLALAGRLDTRVFSYQGGQWVQTALIPALTDADSSVSLFGSTLAIGEPYGHGSSDPQIRVFELFDEEWVNTATIMEDYNFDLAEGYDVELHDADTLVIGSPTSCTGSYPSVRLWARVDGVWQEQWKIEYSWSDCTAFDSIAMTEGFILSNAESRFDLFQRVGDYWIREAPAGDIEYRTGQCAASGDFAVLGATLMRRDGLGWYPMEDVLGADGPIDGPIALSGADLVAVDFAGDAPTLYAYRIGDDCDGDGTADSCQPLSTANDCDQDGVPDACQLRTRIPIELNAPAQSPFGIDARVNAYFDSPPPAASDVQLRVIHTPGFKGSSTQVEFAVGLNGMNLAALECCFSSCLDPTVNAFELSAATFNELTQERVLAIYASMLCLPGYQCEFGDCDKSFAAMNVRYEAEVSYDRNDDGLLDRCQCPGDGNGDSVVDATDLARVLSQWGCQQYCVADLSGDGRVSLPDLGLVLMNFGQPCE